MAGKAKLRVIENDTDYSVANLHKQFTEWDARMTTACILDEIGEERLEQDRKWGEQNHPLIGGWPSFHGEALEEHAHYARVWREIANSRHEYGTDGWDAILLEEVYEALCESDPAKARAELIRVAAVAVAAIESIDRNTPEGESA